MRYPVFIEKDDGSDFGVTVPDLPGCFSAGVTLDEALENSEEAVLTHIEGLLMDDDPIPVPTAIDRISHLKDFSEGIWAIVNCDLSLLSERSKRINITMPEKVITKIDAFASQERESRSGFLVTAALEYISTHSER